MRFFTKQLCALLLFFVTINGWAQYSGTGVFTKITSESQLTSGYYVVTDETDGFLMTSGRSGSATTGFFVSANSGASSSSITNPSASNVWYIDRNASDQITIYSETISKYVGWSSGNSASIEDTPANTNRWTFSYASNKFTVLNVATTSRQLSYNSGSPRFAAYGNNGQQELQFFKLAGYTVTFDANGGTGSMASQTSSSATNLTANTFTRSGYVFTGWNTASNGSGTAYADGASFPFTANTTLYAQWTLSSTPTLIASSLAAFGSQCINGTYGPNSFTITGTALTTANVTVASLSGFEFSTSSGGSYSSSLSLTQAGGAYSQDIYVRFNPTLVQSYDGNIVVGGGGASSVNVAASGSGISTAPSVTTTAATGITLTSASSGGTSISNACGTVTQKGVVWGSTANPTISSNLGITTDGTGTASYSSAISSLTANTSYHYRAYVTNSNGVTSYGNDLTFSTLKGEPTNAPTTFACGTTTQNSIPLSWVDATGATLPDGYLIKWSATSYASITDPTDGSTANGAASTTVNQGIQSATIGSLTQGTTYFFKIYAYTNSGADINYRVLSFGQTSCSTQSGPCLEESFTSTTYPPAGWSETGSSRSTTAADYNTGPAGAIFGSNNGTLTSSVLTNPNSLSFYLGRSSNTTAKTLNINVSTVSQSTGFTTVASFDHSNVTSGTYNQYTVDLSAYSSSSSIWIQFEKVSATTSPWRLDDIAVSCSPSVPSLTANPSSLSGFNYTVGFGPSSTQSFVLSGTSLDGSASVDLLPGDNYEISFDQSTWVDYTTGPITLSSYNGSNTTVYVRLIAGLPVGSYNNALNDIILIDGYGLSPEVALSGSVSPVVAPVITSSLSQSVVYGASVSYTITASNTPTSFNASGLPAGLSVNTSTGVISGTLTSTVGSYSSIISASNSGGTDSQTLTWTVTPKALTVTGLAGQNKVYDGNTSASLSGTASLNGVIGSDVVTLSGTPSGNFANKTVGTGKPITVTGYSLSGADAANYSITQPAGLTGNITAKPLTVSGAVAQTKTYDGNTTATITGATLVGVISPDVVTVSGGGTFASANAGTGIVVTASLSLGGADATNYSITQPTGLSADITKANPVFTTSTIGVTVGGTYSLPGANISSTSNGAFSYSITAGGNASLAGTTISGVSAGTETLTVNQAASANYNAGSTSVTVNVVTFNTGDYRSAGPGNWHSTAGSNTATWEQFNGTSWVSASAPATNAASLGSRTVYIRDTIFLVGTNTAPNVVVANGGRLNTSTVTATFGNLLVQSGGKFYRQANGSGVSGIFEVEDGGTVYFAHSNTTSRSSSIWAGTERFHPNSTFIIQTSQNTGGFLIIEDNADISEYNGACFGNLIIDLGTGKMNLLPPGFSKTLATNLIFRRGTENFNITSGSSTLNILNDLTIENTFTYNITFTTTANTVNSTIGGDLTTNFSNTLRLVNNAAGTVSLTVNGDMLLNAGTLDMNFASGGTGNLSLQGDLAVASGASITANNSTTATLKFSGNNIQDVSGAGTINVYRMVLDKTGGLVNLQRDLQTRLTLTMTNGNLQTNGFTFELGENTTNTGTLSYSSGYVLGNMKRWFSGISAGTDSKDLFPLGYDDSGIKNRFAKIQFTGGTPSGSLTAHFVGSPMGLNDIPIPVGDSNSQPDITFDITSTENQGYWDISVVSGSFSSSETYTATMVGEGFITITDISKIVLLKRPDASTDWFVPGTSGTGVTVSGYAAVQRQGVSSFSHFGFGGGDVNPLPVELIAFDGTCDGEQVQLNWITASELNSARFVVESSSDLVSFNYITETSAAGNSNAIRVYQVSVDRPQQTAYYRLRQEDFDGAFEYFGPIAVSCTVGSQWKIYASSNILFVTGSMVENGPCVVSLSDMNGKQVLQERWSVQGHTLNQNVDLSYLPSGMYVVKLSSGGKTETVKIIIAK